MIKTYDALTILNRAAFLGIEISLDGDDLILEAESDVLKPNVIEVIRAHKPLLIAHLSKQKLEQYAIPEEIALCFTCFDTTGKETPALAEDHNGLMYCKDHHPAYQQGTQENFMRIVHEIADIIPGGCTIHIDPPGYTIDDHVRELTEKQSGHSDFWQHTRENLAKSGYYEKFEKDNVIVEERYAHITGGYEGYCKLYRR